MFRKLTAAALGLVGLAVPQFAQAQTPVAVQVQSGPVGVSVGPGYTVAAPAPIIIPPQPVVVGPSIVVTAPILSPWFWDGHHWIHRPVPVYRPYHYGYRR